MIPSSGEDTEQTECSYIPVEMQNGSAIVENSWAFSHKVKNTLII